MAAGNLGAIGSGGEFQGFAAQDFSAYETKKWSSNAFTLERRRAKDKLLALARSLQAELQDELGTLELGASDEGPTVANGRKVEAQWAFFTRPAEDRTALRPLLSKTDLQGGAGLFDIAVQHQHACLALRLDVRGLALGFELATKAKVDRDNAVEKLKQSWARQKLLEIFAGLPNGATAGFGAEATDALALKGEDVEGWVAALTRAEQPFRVEVLIPHTEEILREKGLIGTLVEHLAAFLPVYRFIAWSRDNEHTHVKGTIQKETAERQKKAAPAIAPGDRVTILSGLFAGRGGYLAEMDVAKGKAKVMVGPVSVTVDAKDLKPG